MIYFIAFCTFLLLAELERISRTLREILDLLVKGREMNGLAD
jgi:hypothetical protein